MGIGEMGLGLVLPSLSLMVLEISVVKWQRWELSTSPANILGGGETRGRDFSCKRGIFWKAQACGSSNFCRSGLL